MICRQVRIICGLPRLVYRFARGCRTVLIISVHGIFSHITAEIELVNSNGSGAIARFLNVQYNMTLDDTTLIVATKHLSEVAADDSQLHITIHIGVVGTAVNKRYLCFGFTAHD